MPKYLYQAKTLKGDSKSGAIEAKDEQDLARILRKEGCLLIKAELAEKEKKKLAVSFSIPFLGRVSLSDKLMFTRNLKVMVSAGVSLPRSLKILSDQTKNKRFRKALLAVRDDIIKGQSFSDSLAKHGDIFSELFVSMIKVGEETGTIEEVLLVLSRQIEKDYQLRSKVKSAMVYPAVIIIAMMGIGTLMLILVIPKLADVFKDMGVELPLTTRIVIATGSFMAAFWYTLPIIVLVLVAGVRFFLKTKQGKLFINTLSLKTPLISPITKKTNSAYTIRTLSSLIKAGVPIVRSLEIVSNSLTNIYYKRATKNCSEKVKRGAKLAEALSEYKDIYPNLVIQMIEVGEETGETSEILDKLAEFFEEEVTNATKNISAVIEPILMLLIGAAVAFFAISMIQPIYGMIQTL
jgi:type IV pilus assembly protein PilC